MWIWKAEFPHCMHCSQSIQSSVPSKIEKKILIFFSALNICTLNVVRKKKFKYFLGIFIFTNNNRVSTYSNCRYYRFQMFPWLYSYIYYVFYILDNCAWHGLFHGFDRSEFNYLLSTFKTFFLNVNKIVIFILFFVLHKEVILQ